MWRSSRNTVFTGEKPGPMLEAPKIPDQHIVACLQSAYGLTISEVAFLPLGADIDTAVYRVVGDDTTPYFLKLRRGNIPDTTVAIPDWLARTGMTQLIPPLATRTTALWTQLPPFTLSLYPFVVGQSGWEANLLEQHWIDFGTALHTLHTTAVPATLMNALPYETYSTEWRDQIGSFLRLATERAFDDPIAENLACLLRVNQHVIEHIVVRAHDLGGILAHQPLDSCLCHGDIHAGNVLVDASGHLYVVDWDTLIIAPKERDLMFIGGGVGGIWNRDQEAQWFYQGYGQITTNLTALTYYRYERIVQDVVVTCAQLLETSAGGDDRSAVLGQLASQFEPDNVVEIAYATDRRLQAQAL